MATASRPEDPSLTASWFDPPDDAPEVYAEVSRLLRAEPYSFEFFQAVWLLERIRGRTHKKVGEFVDPRSEIVRFEVPPTLAFPASEIHDLDSRADPWRMTVNFLGLVGPSGVLPHFYTVLIQDRIRSKDHALRVFLDIFHHRAISLFYRAWRKYRMPVQYAGALGSTIDRCLISLAGIGTPQLEGRQLIEDETCVYFSGLLALQPKSACALEQILADYFDVPVELTQFVGAWYPLSPSFVSALNEGQSLNEQLGFGAVVGDAVWDQQSRARIRLGPMNRTSYDWFLPGRMGYRRLRALTRLYSGDQVDFEVQLVLRRDDVPGCALGEEEGAVQLGWTTWVKTVPRFPRDAEDAVFLLE
jgi:type VI secretion system protein ImpH